MEVRPIRDGDAPGVIALWQACGLVVPWNDPAADLALAERFPNAEILVGVDGDATVAAAMVGHDGHRGWMYYVAVRPDRRGQGLGRQIVAAAERWIHRHEIPKAQLMVRDPGSPVRRFYAALGYQERPRAVMEKWLERPDGPGSTLHVTVTFLEMMEPPPHAPRTAPAMPLDLLRVDRPPLHFYRYLFSAVGEPWLWAARRGLSDDDLAALVHDECVEIHVLYVAGAPAGFAELCRRERPTVSLEYFGLAPEFIGRGLGGYFLDAAVRRAWQNGTRRVIVNTCTLDHPRALPGYQNAGFRVVRQVDRMVADPRLNGLIAPHVAIDRHPIAGAGA